MTKKLMLILAALAMGTLWVPIASAACANPLDKAHISRQSWNPEDGFVPNLRLVNYQPTMIGMWHVAFIAEGNGPGLPPDGTQVDDALSLWHIDGTEATVSSRAPETGDVCLGVWERVGERHYKLNHFGISFDPATDPNTPQGFANIRQDINLSRDGMTFKGKFSIQQYDSQGNQLVEIKGDLLGTRITLSTSVANLLKQN